MAKIKDYRTPRQKKMDEIRNAIFKRHSKLMSEGLSNWRAAVITAEEFEWTAAGVLNLLRRMNNAGASTNN